MSIAGARGIADLCPVCQHLSHRDEPCPWSSCSCRYQRTMAAALDRFAQARREFIHAIRATIRRGNR